MTRRELLDKAAAKTCGNREDTFPRIAKLWSANGDNVTPLDVCIKMMLLKIGRVQAGQSVEDSLVDIAGYAACAAEYIDKPMRNPFSASIVDCNMQNSIQQA